MVERGRGVGMGRVGGGEEGFLGVPEGREVEVGGGGGGGAGKGRGSGDGGAGGAFEDG